MTQQELRSAFEQWQMINPGANPASYIPPSGWTGSEGRTPGAYTPGFDQFGAVIPPLSQQYQQTNQYMGITPPSLQSLMSHIAPSRAITSILSANPVLPDTVLSTDTSRGVVPNIAPQLITPYSQRATGPGAYGESDIFSKKQRL